MKSNEYKKNGFTVLEKAIPEELLQKYEDVWRSEVGDVRDDQGLLVGWNKWDSYLDHTEIMDILCHSSVHEVFTEIDRGVALHSSRTYGTSTTMGWHHDSALDNEIAAENYIGVWVALEDVTPESGPFELIVGSHLWDLDFAKLYAIGDNAYEGTYGSYEYLLEEIEKRQGETFTFLAKRGDVLVWHGRLVHRGTIPQKKDATRMSIIGHYCNNYAHKDQEDLQPDASTIFSSMDEDAKRYAKWESGGYYFK
jgi:ectoine hydroxylase-related dioxygenase (phytanoyl-CoA dioxygenase family)